jgi:predicted  nucleic acid-binding Zn-ribbon protein
VSGHGYESTPADLARSLSAAQEQAKDLEWSAEHALYRLAEQERENAELREKLTWTPADWDAKLTAAKKKIAECYATRTALRDDNRKLAAALDEALHDAKRWRSIADDTLAELNAERAKHE